MEKELLDKTKNQGSFAYYPGCSLNSTAVDFNASAQKLFKALGQEFEEIEDWNCCGTTPANNVSPDMALALSARNLLLAKKMGYEEIVSPCVSCYCKLYKSAAILNDSSSSKKGKITGIFREMGFEVDIDFNFRIYSIVEFLLKNIDSISKKYSENRERKDKAAPTVKKSGRKTGEQILESLRPVCYYGCVLLRTRGVRQFDDPENPSAMEKILEAINIKSLHFRFKTECCGAILSLTNKDIVLGLSKQILDAAIEAGANSIVVCCPLCQQNLDLRQSQINRYYRTDYMIPVYYITQVVGMGLGLSYEDVMADKLFVEPER